MGDQQSSNRKKMIGVFQFDYKTGKYMDKFISIREAERQTGIKGSDISKCCRGLVRQAGGCRWTCQSNY